MSVDRMALRRVGSRFFDCTLLALLREMMSKVSD